jgi:hypothetical protein
MLMRYASFSSELGNVSAGSSEVDEALLCAGFADPGASVDWLAFGN